MTDSEMRIGVDTASAAVAALALAFCAEPETFPVFQAWVIRRPATAWDPSWASIWESMEPAFLAAIAHALGTGVDAAKAIQQGGAPRGD